MGVCVWCGGSETLNPSLRETGRELISFRFTLKELQVFLFKTGLSEICDNKSLSIC